MARSHVDGDESNSAEYGPGFQRHSPTGDTLRPAQAEEAEEAVAGAIVLSAGGAELARSRLKPSDFYRPDFGRLLERAEELPSGPLDARIAVAASITGLEASEVEDLVHFCPTMTDAAGIHSRRVKDAGLRREIQRRTLDIALDAPDVEADQMLSRIEAAASRANQVADLAREAERSRLASIRPVVPGGGTPALGAFVNRRSPGIGR